MRVNVIRLGSLGLPLGIQSINSDMYINLTLTLGNWILFLKAVAKSTYAVLCCLIWTMFLI